jgi:phenylpyruvate tautomerase PptA (4-oxalocrotonate tautomerase family)
MIPTKRGTEMPHIRIRGINPEQALKFSETFKAEAATIVNTSADNFTIELIETKFFHEGTIDPGYPFIEVLWFERPQEVKDRFATHITERMRRVTNAKDVAVLFVPLQKEDYFENGNHF